MSPKETCFGLVKAWTISAASGVPFTEEFETGGRIKTPRGPLDASSDAVGYLTGHWNRTTSWGFGRWVETCLKPGRDYENDFEGWLQKHLQMHTGLFTEDLQFDEAVHQEESLRRVIQEMTYRSTMSLEHLPETSKAADAAESILEPWLDQVHQTLVGDTCALTTLEELTETWFGLLPTLQTYLPDHVAQALGGLGLRRLNKSLNVIQLQEGLHAIDVDVALEDVEKFANSTDFASQGFLVERWDRLEPSPQTSDAAFFSKHVAATMMVSFSAHFPIWRKKFRWQSFASIRQPSGAK